MPGKIIWLAMTVTVVYWLGSIIGCTSSGDNQNFKILEDEPHLLDTTDAPSQPGAFQMPAPTGEADRAAASFVPDANIAAPEVVPDLVPDVAVEVEATIVAEPVAEVTPEAEAEATAADSATIAAEPVAEATPEAEAETPAAASVTVETEPSLDGLDRSGWARMTTSADSGVTPVQPHYFEDRPLADIRAAAAEPQPLGNAEAAGWDRANSRSVVVQPIKFLRDLILLPISIYRDPPRDLQARSPLNRLVRSTVLPSQCPAADAIDLADPVDQ